MFRVTRKMRIWHDEFLFFPYILVMNGCVGISPFRLFLRIEYVVVTNATWTGNPCSAEDGQERLDKCEPPEEVTLRQFAQDVGQELTWGNVLKNGVTEFFADIFYHSFFKECVIFFIR